MLQKSQKRSRISGFTLIEILIVIALVAVLATLAIGQLGGFLEDGNESVAEIFVSTTLKAPLTKYRINTGSYPTTEQGLQALITAPAGQEGKWRGPYIEKLPEDPWKTPYQYRYPGTKNSSGARGYDVWSYGPDKVESDDDIGNWE